MNLFDRNGADAESLVGPDLASRLDRLRSLRSAWAVLAPSRLADNSEEISASGAAVTEYFETLVAASDSADAQPLSGLDALIDEFEMSMQLTASRVPIAKIRTSLSWLVSEERQGLLDLLDVYLGADTDQDRSSDGRIYAIDYLIALLCASKGDAGGAINADPVSLTPRLESICQHADTINDPRLDAIAAQFFGAANMDAEALRDELQQRTLRTTKAELGNGFFSSSVLRAIVTYNAALFERVGHDTIDPGTWKNVEGRVTRPVATASVFACPPLAMIAASLARRVRGEPAETGASDRIAWSVDLDWLTAGEKKCLLIRDITTQNDPIGTAILIGLLDRSIAVLAIDLQELGIDPDHLSGTWTDEVAQRLQAMVDEMIVAKDDRKAHLLKKVRMKFLSSAAPDDARTDTASEAVDKPVAALTSTHRYDFGASASTKRETARELVKDALAAADTGTGREHSFSSTISGLSSLPIAKIAFVFSILVLLPVGFYTYQQQNSDLDNWSREQLAKVSPYLEGGRRNGQGMGPAFVGTIDDEWLALPSEERSESAEDLVLRLREFGIEQVMIYDDDRSLRIQAIGTQPVRTL